MTSVSPAVSSTADRTFAGRQTPWSNEAEQAILGAMLLDQDAALNAAELLDNAEHRVFQVAQMRRSEEFIRIKELIWPTMERIEQLQSGHGTVTGVPTGFVDLDRLTAGFQPSDLVIVAARPSMGKTALALNIVQHAAIEHNVPVA